MLAAKAGPVAQATQKYIQTQMQKQLSDAQTRYDQLAARAHDAYMEHIAFLKSSMSDIDTKKL